MPEGGSALDRSQDGVTVPHRTHCTAASRRKSIPFGRNVKAGLLVQSLASRLLFPQSVLSCFPEHTVKQLLNVSGAHEEKSRRDRREHFDLLQKVRKLQAFTGDS